MRSRVARGTATFQAAAECINSPLTGSTRTCSARYAVERRRRWSHRRLSRDPYTPLLVSQRPFGCLFEIVETLVLTLVIFLVIQNFVAQPYRVQQQSMEHTLEP